MKGNLIVLICIFFWSSGVFAQNAFFRYVKPPVTIISPDGQEEVANKDSVADVGDSIKVGEGGLAIIELEDRSSLKIEAGSVLALQELVKEEGPDEYVGSSSVILSLGSMFIEVVKKFGEAPNLNVKNNRSVALGIRGTELFAGVDGDNGDFYTSVKSGEVEVYDVEKDDSDSVKAGESMVVEQGRTITRATNFEWGKRLRWDSGEESGSNFPQWKRQARQEFLGQAGTLRNRSRRPVAERFRKWQARRLERRRPVATLSNLLDRRKWREQPSELKQKRRAMMQRRRQRFQNNHGRGNRRHVR